MCQFAKKAVTQFKVTVNGHLNAVASQVFTVKCATSVQHCLAANMVTATTVSNASAQKAGTAYSVQNRYATKIVIRVKDIATGQENADVDQVGLVISVKNVNHYQDVCMEHAQNHQNVNVKRDGKEFCVRYPYALKVVIEIEDIVVNQMNAGAKQAGGVKTVLNVSHTQVVFMAHVTVHGNVIVSPAGVECSVIKS